jgi:hypothetical protein
VRSVVGVLRDVCGLEVAVVHCSCGRVGLSMGPDRERAQGPVITVQQTNYVQRFVCLPLTTMGSLLFSVTCCIEIGYTAKTGANISPAGYNSERSWFFAVLPLCFLKGTLLENRLCAIQRDRTSESVRSFLSSGVPTAVVPRQVAAARTIAAVLLQV